MPPWLQAKAATGELMYRGCSTLTRQPQIIHLFSLEMILPLTDDKLYQNIYLSVEIFLLELEIYFSINRMNLGKSLQLTDEMYISSQILTEFSHTSVFL